MVSAEHGACAGRVGMGTPREHPWRAFECRPKAVPHRGGAEGPGREPTVKTAVRSRVYGLRRCDLIALERAAGSATAAHAAPQKN